jgi:hypothetical protein
MPAFAEAAAGRRLERNPWYRAQGKKSAKYMGKNQECRRADILAGTKRTHEIAEERFG